MTKQVSFTLSYQCFVSFSERTLSRQKEVISSHLQKNTQLSMPTCVLILTSGGTDVVNKDYWKTISWEQFFISTKEGAELNQWPRSERLCNLITHLLSYAVHPPFIFTDKRESYYLSNFCSHLAMQKLSFSALKGH